MKKFLFFLFFLVNCAFNAQSPGDLIGTPQKKVDLTPTGVLNLIDQFKILPEILRDLIKNTHIGVQGYKINYWTTNLDGTLTEASGMVLIPLVDKPLPTILYCHPMTERYDYVPSRMSGSRGLEFLVPLVFSTNGFAMVCPDYLGLGDSKEFHLSLFNKTNGRASIDALKAGDALLRQLKVEQNGNYYITGYSEGGHAGMAALKYNTEEAKYKNFKYMFVGGGPYDMSETTLQNALSKAEMPLGEITAMMVSSCKAAGYDLYQNSYKEIISDEYQDNYEKHFHNKLDLVDLKFPKNWKNFFKKDFVDSVTKNPKHPLRLCFVEQVDNYDWYNKTPSSYAINAIDLTVPPENAEVAKTIQRSKYGKFDLKKFQIRTENIITFGHITASVPFFLAALSKFKFLDGINSRSYQTPFSKTTEINTQLSDRYQFNGSWINPLIEFPYEDVANIKINDLLGNSYDSNLIYGSKFVSLKDLPSMVYVITIKFNDGTTIKIPFFKELNKFISNEDLVNASENTIIVNLTNIKNTKVVNLFDRNKNLIESVDLKPELQNKKFTFDASNLEPSSYYIEIHDENHTVYPIKYEYKQSRPKEIPVISKTLRVWSQDHKINIWAKLPIEHFEIYSLRGSLKYKSEKINKNETNCIFSEKGMFILKAFYEDGSFESRKFINLN